MFGIAFKFYHLHFLGLTTARENFTIAAVTKASHFAKLKGDYVNQKGTRDSWDESSPPLL